MEVLQGVCRNTGDEAGFFEGAWQGEALDPSGEAGVVGGVQKGDEIVNDEGHFLTVRCKSGNDVAAGGNKPVHRAFFEISSQVPMPP